jgi:hypothetical protein
VLTATGLERLGLLDGSGRPADAPPVSLSGLESMRLTTEDLPRLAQLPGVAVEVAGEPADYRDVADSLEIGVSTADIAGERDWFDLGVTIRVEGRELPFAEVFAALASGESDLLLEDGAHFSLLEPRLQSLRHLIEEARALTDSQSGPLRISRYHAGLWSELVALGVVTEQAQAWQRQVGALLELDALAQHDPPESLTAQLRPYQRDGFGWLASLRELELGGILADDMGLGKTLQALAMICHAGDGDTAAGPFLVVAPTSVISNWTAEAARFAPGLAVAAVTDTLARSGRSIDEFAEADAVVTTYTLLRLDADAYRRVDWAGVILDEAQYVKNHQAKTYRCVRELAAPFKLAITGTPMENNLMELWSLLSITAPGLFPDPKRFAEQYARPIERAGDAERLERLRRRIKPLVKRRTKELVAADLPPKQEQTLDVDLHPRHRKLYDTYLQRERQKILGLIDDFDRNRFTILRSITLLRQLSLHPGTGRRQQRRRALRQARRARRAARRRDRWRPPCARIQPVHGIPRQGPRPPRPRAHRLLLPRRQHPLTRPRARALQGWHGPRISDQPQGRRLRPEPHRGRLLLPAGPVVEPGHRDAGDRPHPPHRPDTPGDGLPPRRARHDRGEGRRARATQGRAVQRRHGRRRPVRQQHHRAGHPRTAQLIDGAAGARWPTSSCPAAEPELRGPRSRDSACSRRAATVHSGDAHDERLGSSGATGDEPPQPPAAGSGSTTATTATRSPPWPGSGGSSHAEPRPGTPDGQPAPDDSSPQAKPSQTSNSTTASSTSNARATRSVRKPSCPRKARPQVLVPRSSSPLQRRSVTMGRL